MNTVNENNQNPNNTINKKKKKNRKKKSNAQTTYARTQPFQLGLWATGQEKTVTPVCLPVSSGHLESLDRAEIARLLPCPVDHLEIVVSPFSTLFGPEHHIICAYDVGPRGLFHPTGPEPGIPFANNPGELCCHAVHMTRSLVHSFGSQINGNAIFFYLKPGKDFTFEPDFKAVQEFITAWDKADGNCSNVVLKRLARTFHDSLKKYEDKLRTEDRVDNINIAIFPALDDKPFIIKHPLRYVPPEELGDAPFHTLVSDALLGSSPRETTYVNRSPKHGILQNTLRIYITTFLLDKSPINESIRAATRRIAVHPWAGNILVLKEKRGSSELCEDITDEDVDFAIEYFSLYGRL